MEQLRRLPPAVDDFQQRAALLAYHGFFSLFPLLLVAALAWAPLQWLGGWYVARQLSRASATYGTFALVIGLLSWLYLASTVTLLAAELNVVRARRLWPRSLAPPPLGRPDERALEGLARQEERLPTSGSRSASATPMMAPDGWTNPAEHARVDPRRCTVGGFVSRGFRRRRRTTTDQATRLPPGQYVEPGFPVLSAGPTPRVDLKDWRFKVEGLVKTPREWTWEEIHDLRGSSFEGDIHCVTRWSKLGTSFAGVSVDTLLDAAEPRPEATHVVAFCYGGYTTNLPLDDVRGGKAWVVWDHEGAPLPPEHGGPARLLVPHLYFWKSAKWVAGLRLLDHDAPGFWESLGYHNLGDPWREQRYWGD